MYQKHGSVPQQSMENRLSLYITALTYTQISDVKVLLPK